MMNICEDVILIRPTRLYYAEISQAELYEITRGIWKLAERRHNAEYAFAVIDYKVAGCYKIHSWHEAMETEYFLRKDLETLKPHELENRYEFVGAFDIPMEEKYLGKNLKSFYAKGNANPVMYVNC